MKQAMQQYQEQLHISHSQIFCYLACSLKYQFQYVERRPRERTSLALSFGKAIHLALERYYRSLKDDRKIVSLSLMESLFEESLILELDNCEVPVIFKNEAPDTESAIQMGKALLNTFYDNIDLAGMEIVDIELPLSAPLYTGTGEKTDINLVGFIDLLLKDADGNLLVVDNKTSKQKKSQDTVDDDLQMSAYSYLLAANGYVFPRAEVNCRFDVLRKLKTPKLEHYFTSRTGVDRKRFARIANGVLAGIEQRIFIPVKGWLCSDCSYADTCSKW
ncbi:MAG: PD-(D/E)XK nuclease family protein [Desulfobulbales bacterium]